jgi:hypothetical protein
MRAQQKARTDEEEKGSDRQEAGEEIPTYLQSISL